MLEIENLSVALTDNPEKVIIRNLSLSIPDGEVHVLFGPNGSGKSTLLKTIMGFPQYTVLKGKIIFKGKDITNKSIDERARLGMGISFQRPPNIPGLHLNSIAEYLVKQRNETTAEIGFLAKKLRLREFLNRDVNVNFSGGEIKRSELLQLLLQDPDFILLDEPESGVDIEAMKLIGEMINVLLGDRGYHERRTATRKKSALVITHTGNILDYIHADMGHISCHGFVGCSGTPSRLLEDITTAGYPPCSYCSDDDDEEHLHTVLLGEN